MSERQAFQEKFQRGLKEVLEDPSVEVEQDHSYKFLVSVVSPSFEEMDDGGPAGARLGSDLQDPQ